jgi:hypothetical protein
MNPEITVDPKQLRDFEKRMANYGKIVQKTHSETMVELGKSVARQLAHRTQPYGLSDAVGEKYAASIRTQVGRALNNANLTEGSGTVATEHGARRDGRGRVPKSLADKGQFKREPIEIIDRNEYAKRKAANAGMLKAAWIAAGEALGGPKMSRVKKWIGKHVSKMEGKAKVFVGGIFKHHEIWLTNSVAYAGRALRKGDMQKAVNEAFRRQLRTMIIQIKKAEEKIARMERSVK